jgi:TRAP-type C4-dicarboxylate transport system substrate-binding protein
MNNLTIRVNKVFRYVLGALSAFAAVAGHSAYAENLVARMSGHWSPKHQSAIHSQIFADEVTKRSEGRLTIQFYPSKQLFGIREVMGAVSSGAVELGGVVGVVSFPPINKNFNVASYPGLFSSYEQQRNFFQKSDAGRAVWDDLTQKSNSKLIMYNPVGPVMTFSSARELTGIDAMKGLKARALLKSERPMWDAYEANTVSLPTGEVYTALQTGMIDTINSPPGSIEAYSWWEYLAFAQKPYQYFADAYIMANQDWFNSLPKDLQDIVMDVGAEVGALATDTILNAGESTLAKFVERGGVLTTLSGDEKAKFNAMMADKVMPAMADMFDKNVLLAAEAFARQ